MNKMEIQNSSPFDFDRMEDQVKDIEKILFIFSCGYEKRSLSILKKMQSRFPSSKVSYLCLNFSTYKNAGSRKSNDEILHEYGIDGEDFDPRDWKGVWTAISNAVNEDPATNKAVYIDYSSMPRNWYCELGKKVISGEMGKNATMLYCSGTYKGAEYPCVGYGEFNMFSGRPNITETKEVCLFGLGFDSTRTYGIWNFLDPQTSVAVIGRTPENRSITGRVLQENSEIIAASEKVVEIRMDLFSNAISDLVDLARLYSKYGDVALVPDGPKPLILAMSLVPCYLDVSGVYCWHVGHVKPVGYEPLDVGDGGSIYSFSLSDFSL